MKTNITLILIVFAIMATYVSLTAASRFGQDSTQMRFTPGHVTQAYQICAKKHPNSKELAGQGSRILQIPDKELRHNTLTLHLLSVLAKCIVNNEIQ